MLSCEILYQYICGKHVDVFKSDNYYVIDTEVFSWYLAIKIINDCVVKYIDVFTSGLKYNES